jgi:RNA polymerase primary sigma factor
MLTEFTADTETLFINIDATAVHLNRGDVTDMGSSHQASLHPDNFLFGSAGRTSLCADELSRTETLKVHNIAEEEKEASDDDLVPASSAPVNDPYKMYLREIRLISVSPHQAETRFRKDLKASKERITRIVLRTPLAIKEIISLGCKLENGTMSIREITDAVPDEATEDEVAFYNNQVMDLLRRVKLAEQKKQMLCKRIDCGKLNAPSKDMIQQKINHCIKQQVGLLRQMHLNWAVISDVVLKLKHHCQRTQKAHHDATANHDNIKHNEEQVMPRHAALKQTIAIIEGEENKIRQGRDMLVTAHLGVVVYLAKKYKNRGLDYFDLIQEGNIGLMKAAKRFDESKKYHFKSEAIWYIKNAMIRAIIKQGKTIRVPDYVCIIMNKLARVSSRLLRETGKKPTVEEIGKIIGIAPDKFRHHAGMQQFVSLDTRQDERGAICLGDLIEDTKCVFPGDIADRHSMHSSVKDMMERLNQQEKTVVSMRYGIGYESDHTLEKVGQSLSLTRQRVKQIEDKALSKLVKYSKMNGLQTFIEA